MTTTTKRVKTKLSKAYWDSVSECLVAFHGHDHATALEVIAVFQKGLSKRALLFAEHEEPFNMACGLAGKELDIRKFADKYEAILQKIGW